MSRARTVRVLVAALLAATAACTSPVSVGGVEGDGPREDDTAALLELPGVEHVLVSTDPVEDSDYSITRAVVDLAADADVDEVAGVLEALAGLDAVDGATWVTVGAGSAEIDEYGDLVPPPTPVPTVRGRLDDPDSADRVATAVLEGTAVAGAPARVVVDEEGILLELYLDGDVTALAEAGRRLSAASYAQADRVDVLGAGILRLGSGEEAVDERAVEALLAIERDRPALPAWLEAWPLTAGTEYDRVVLEQTLVASAQAPRAATPRERRAVTRWVEHALDVVAGLPVGSDLEIASQPEGDRDPLDLYLGVTVPEPGAARPERTGDPWLDAARAYLYDRRQRPAPTRTS